MMEQWYTLKEIAEKFKVTVQTIRNWIRQGKIRAIKLGGNWRISQSEVDNFTEESSKKGKEI
jgi:excisionase family DNA binding protein